MTASRIEQYGVDDYKLTINDGGTIEINVGSGTVVINGDLDVNGSQTSITSSELIVSDKTLTLNNQSNTLYDIVGITQANPAQVELSDAHSFTDGSEVIITNVLGMVELNNNTYYVNVVDPTTVELFADFALTTPVDTSGFIAYISDGNIQRVIATGIGGDEISGIIMDRGTLPNAVMFYDENLLSYTNGVLEANAGAFKFGLEGSGYLGIYTSSIKTEDGNDLNLLPGSNLGGVVSVSGTLDYEKRLAEYDGSEIKNVPTNSNRLSGADWPGYEPDAIPNLQFLKDYVRDYHKYNWQYRINAVEPDGTTKVEAFSTLDGVTSLSNVRITVDGSEIAYFYETSAEIALVTIDENTISASGLDSDLKLSGNNLGDVQVLTPMLFPKLIDPALTDTEDTPPTDGTKIYAKDEADGGTGLYFINELGTQDELISRNKALLYSIIF
jgi:hypothetical protein